MDEDEERIARLETAMRRLHEAWPEQIRVITNAADTMRRRSSESDAAMVNELRRIHDRLTAIEERLS